MKANYLFYFCDGIGSVFDSQVLALLKSISEKNIFKKIYLFLGIRNDNQKNAFLAKKLPVEIEIVLFKTYPNYPFFNYLNRKSIQKVLNCQRINFNDVIFHTRGELIAWHLSKVLSKDYFKQIIPDVRGASVEEVDEFYYSNKLIKSIKIGNYKKAVINLIEFNKISVVSNALKDHLIKYYKVDPEKIVLTPCLADSNFCYDDSKRYQIREELNLSEDEKLIVFSSGGTANWQNNEVLMKLAEKGIKILNLAKKEIYHKNIINRFIDYSEMPIYLNAADIAIIWRDKSIVNKVASPVKFSEYICCGLPVIANNSVDMITEYITKQDSGLIVDFLDNFDVGILNKLKQKDRKKISESGIMNFGVDKIVNQYIQTYY